MVLLAMTAPPLQAAPPEALPLAVAINGRTASDGTVVLRESDGTYAIAFDDAMSWRLALPTEANQEYDGQAYVALRAIPDIRVQRDDATESLDLHIPPRYFQATRIDGGGKIAADTPVYQRGAFLDYDLQAQAASTQPGIVNAIFNAGANIGAGVLNAGFLGGIGSGVSGLRRIATSWQRDDVTRRATLRLGDAAADAEAIIPERPFFGAQLLSNFSTAPGFVVSRRPSVSGALDAPATAEVYVDGRLVLQENLPTGPFRIDNIPVTGSAGQLQVVTKDASGREQVITNSAYYESPSLLRQGVREFSMGMGLEAFPTGTTERYGAPIAQAFEKCGITDRFTGELNAQLARDGSSLSAGGAWLIPGLGTFDAGITGGGQAGNRFDYEYLGRRGFSFGFGKSSLLQNNLIVTAPSLQTPLPPLSISRDAQMHVSVPLSSRAAFSLSIDNQAASASAIRTLSGSYIASLPHRMQLQVSLLRTSGSLRLNSATAQLTIPLDARRNETLSVQGEGGHVSAGVAYAAGALLDGASAQPGYAFAMDSSNVSGQVFLSKKAMDLSAGFSRTSGVDYYQMEARGSIASLEHRLLPSRSIDQAYGVAVVPGYSNIRVYANGHFEGVTDARGEIALPDLQAYQRNVVSLESKDLPVTANISSLNEIIVPYYHSPVTVRFPVRGNGGAIVHVRMPEGRFMPSGAVLSADDSSWVVADQGEVYLDGVMPGNLRMTASGGDIHCAVAVVIPKDLASIPDIGEAVCR